MVLDLRPLSRRQPAIGVARQHLGVETVEAVVSRLDLLSSDAEADEPIQLVVFRSE